MSLQHLLNFCYTFSFAIFLIIFSSSFVCEGEIFQGIKCPIESIYQVGDSISDTGNLVLAIPQVPASRKPYGITFPGHPSGRWSDGRLIIDYIAASLGLPPLNPYQAKNASFLNGVNFAVAGSTVLNPKFYIAQGTSVPPLPPLLVQLENFKKYLKSICLTPTECRVKLRRSLVFVGEFGYNDIGYSFQQGRSIKKIQDFLPLVNRVILNATREVVQLGAQQVIVPGIFPLGCFPFALSSVDRDHANIFDKIRDELGCLKNLNNIIASRNNDLQRELSILRLEYPNVNLLYSNLYDPFLSLLRNAPALGFNIKTLFSACCGLEGNFVIVGPIFCGNGDVPLCPNPNNHIHWDGFHLTQASYHYIANYVIRDLKLKCI
ncbi:acetylajmalan esterase-like [Andrographis paniculata]|uniref:acetylajmalan esterase-like n=1 Tax=Andrographis paniculata TaxID=175694 RepID=UPI0021E8793E|nr:acetylajmalan esterase-like [Andrographis paniculata]